jgi:hypothetical protein
MAGAAILDLADYLPVFPVVMMLDIPIAVMNALSTYV